MPIRIASSGNTRYARGITFTRTGRIRRAGGGGAGGGSGSSGG